MVFEPNCRSPARGDVVVAPLINSLARVGGRLSEPLVGPSSSSGELPVGC